MAAKDFIQKRIEESLAIFKDHDGDMRLYNLRKAELESLKRKRQNEISQDEVMYELDLHNQRFPRWFNVTDGSDLYISNNFRRIDRDRLENVSTITTAELPVRCETNEDMCEVLKLLLETHFVFDRMNVALSYDNTTIDVPQKMVLMRHEEGSTVIPEALKHQARPQSPFLVTDVIGGKFDDSKRPVLVTDFEKPHTRYLYKDWSRYQFHEAVPKRDVPMRVCYGIHPHTVSVITVYLKNTKIVLFKAMPHMWHIEKDSVLGAIEVMHYFCT